MRRRFEAGCQLAYLFDVEEGYRKPPPSQWSFVPIDSSHREPLTISEIIPKASDAPLVTIEPGRERGSVRVVSDVALVTLAFNETMPRVASSAADLESGSVVRIGPLLFAHLDSEQADSVVAGRLQLPIIGEACTCLIEGSEEQDEPRRFPRWTVRGVLLGRSRS